MCCAPIIHTSTSHTDTQTQAFLRTCIYVAVVRSFALNLFWYSLSSFVSPPPLLPYLHTWWTYDSKHLWYRQHTHMCSHEPSIEYITRRKRDRRANVNQWFVRSLSDRNRIFKHFALFHLRFCFCLNRLCLLFLIPSMLCTESGNHQTDDTLASGQFCV